MVINGDLGVNSEVSVDSGWSTVLSTVVLWSRVVYSGVKSIWVILVMCVSIVGGLKWCQQ